MAIPFQLPLEQLLEEKPIEKERFVGVSIDNEFPEESATLLAQLESFNKHLFRPNTYLHKWWARRAGTTFRHILKQLVVNPTRKDFYLPGGLESQIILDPMMGGGTTLHEAIRMGANVVGIDVDPIPVLQVKASLTQIPLAQKKAVFRLFYDALRAKLSHLYTTRCPDCKEESEIQFSLYGQRQRCNCREVVTLDSFLLRENWHGGDIRICPNCRGVWNTPGHSCDENPDIPLIEKSERKCGSCGTSFTDLATKPFWERYVPLVVVGVCPKHGQFFKSVDEYDEGMIARALELSRQLDFGPPEEFIIPTGPKSIDLKRRNINSFLELFTPRQLLYIASSINLMSTQDEINRLWLSLLVSTSLEFNCLLAGYKGVDKRRPGAVRHVFSHHAYSIPYTALENNPIFPSPTSGTLLRLFNDRILRAAKWATHPVETRILGDRSVKVPITGEIDGGIPVQTYDELRKGQRSFLLIHGDARELSLPEESVDYVVTDPPYYDSVQYGDLSHFFRVWLRLLMPDEVTWKYDQSKAVVVGNDKQDEGKFSDNLTDIWKVCHKVLKKQGRLIFTFHHWRASAWAELTISLKRSGFMLVNKYVVFSENPISVHIRQLKALKHDVILVLKARSSEEEIPKWPHVTIVDVEDSHNFCRDCGNVLGWLLNSDYTEERIHQEWHSLIGDNH
jgi:putative DNA methylase